MSNFVAYCITPTKTEKETLYMESIQEFVQTKPDDELLSMVYQFDQWNPDMLKAVEQELSARKILPGDLAMHKKDKIEKEAIELSEGKEASLIGQVVGWLTVFGLLGVVIGYNYAFSKVKSKYSASQYFKYNEESRKNGKYLFYTSLVLSAVFILYKLFRVEGTGI